MRIEDFLEIEKKAEFRVEVEEFLEELLDYVRDYEGSEKGKTLSELIETREEWVRPEHVYFWDWLEGVGREKIVKVYEKGVEVPDDLLDYKKMVWELDVENGYASCIHTCFAELWSFFEEPEEEIKWFEKR